MLQKVSDFFLDSLRTKESSKITFELNHKIINQLEPGRPLEVKFFLPSTSILLFGLRPESFLWWDLVTSEPFIPITKTLKASVKIERRQHALASVAVHFSYTPMRVIQCFIATDQIWRERLLRIPHYGPWLF